MKIGSLLAANARRYPDKVAFVSPDRRLTFGELDERANRLANTLATGGLRLGDRVVIHLNNGIELVEAMAGVLKAGGIIVPVSTRLTAAEIAHIVGDCEAAAIVYSDDLRHLSEAALARNTGVRRLVVGKPGDGEESFDAAIRSGSPVAPEPPPASFDDCIIGYTSGTTGRPKGAVSTHANIILANGFMNSIEWELTSRDVIMATTAMAHRTGLGRLVNAFYLGCRVVMQPRFDAAEALSLIEQEQVTVVGGVPTVFRLMMPEFEKRPEAARSVRLIVATGEVFPVPLKNRLKSALPHAGLYSFLAQTESGFIAGLRPEEQEWKPNALGRPVPGVEVRLVDPGGHDVPLGQPGEILMRCGTPGHGLVMREYFRNPTATAEAFVGDWFRTGDVGYFDEDGFLYFADRAKDMIVSGGLNIYSKEVEMTLQEHPAVDDAAVFGVPDAEFGEAVAACVVLRKGQAASADDLIEHCRARIASYKKPRVVRFMDDLPRTGTGKILKHELRKLVAS